MRSVPGSERGPEPAFSKESAEDFQKRKFLQRFCLNLKKEIFFFKESYETFQN
jgi:hypothetical protein